MMDSTMAQMMAELIPRETNLAEMMAEMRAHYSAQNLVVTKAQSMAPRRACYSAQSSAETMARTRVEMMAPMKVPMLDW